jgi:hypothetical protein
LLKCSAATPAQNPVIKQQKKLLRPQQIAFSTAKSTRFAVETANSKSHQTTHLGLQQCVWASSNAFEPSTIFRTECYCGAKTGSLARALSSHLLVVMNSVRAHCDCFVLLRILMFSAGTTEGVGATTGVICAAPAGGDNCRRGKNWTTQEQLSH